MRKSLNIIAAVIITLGLSACGKAETSGSVASVTGFETSNTSVNLVQNNTRIDYTIEEVAEIINSSSRFKTAEDFSASVPKSINYVSKFYCGTTAQLPFEESVSDFRAAFEYLFPNHEFDENCFFYDGADTSGGAFKKVYDNYDALVNGEVFYVFFYYEGKTDKENRVALTLRSPFGSDITTINKGVGGKIAYQRGLASSYGGDIFMPSYHFEYIGSFTPDSEKSFKLLDKEISIKDAVEFFESYIKALPCSIESVYSNHVNDVQVYKIDDELYCYNFTTSRMYNNIPFDYAVSGSHGGRSSRDLGIGEMIKSDDVDFIYGTFKTATIMEEQRFSEIIPFEKAVEITSEKMSEYVDFDVSSAMLVYCTNADINGSGKLGETKEPVFPAWKITLYNTNDNRYYSCYVNALDGGFESYRG